AKVPSPAAGSQAAVNAAGQRRRLPRCRGAPSRATTSAPSPVFDQGARRSRGGPISGWGLRPALGKGRCARELEYPRGPSSVCIERIRIIRPMRRTHVLHFMKRARRYAWLKLRSSTSQRGGHRAEAGGGPASDPSRLSHLRPPFENSSGGGHLTPTEKH